MAGEDDALRMEAAAWLARLRGEPAPPVIAAFEAWYSRSERHAAAYDAVLDSWDRSGALADAGQRVGVPPRQSWHLSLPIKLSASAILLLFAYAILAMLRTPDRAVGYGDTGGAPIETPSRDMALADGSHIMLDQDAVVRTAFTTAERRVILVRGRARFIVAHQADRRFVVEAADSLVIAHGTVFDVTMARDALLVSLLRGSVEVRHQAWGQARRPEARMLAPGQQIAVTAAGMAAARPIPAAETEWARPMLSFDGVALGDVARAASRPGSPRLILADETVRQLRFTGTIRAGDADELAAMIGPMFDLAIARDGAGNYVATRRDKKIPGS